MIAAIAASSRFNNSPPAGTDKYRHQIRLAVDEIPFSVGDWLGTEVSVAGIDMLRANAVMSRRYRQIEGNAAATIIFVHCQDSRDLLGHYPPHCYPSQGWTKTGEQSGMMSYQGFHCDFTEYGFSRQEMLDRQEMVIINFFLLPDGRMVPNMEGVNRISQDNRRKHFGAGQVQIIVSPQLPATEKIETLQFFLDLLRPTMTAVLSGVNDEFH